MKENLEQIIKDLDKLAENTDSNDKSQAYGIASNLLELLLDEHYG